MILPLDPHSIADLDRIGSIIGEHGIDAVPSDLLRNLAHDAKDAGVRPVAVSVLVDPTDPIVARERAFAVVACGLIGARSRRPTPPEASA
ncbi:MAG: hypothetical protein R8G01_12345 [Ilumatobacteraceae bacterium]|nr:hypothetical protein [Ilumatobacteraceae bacterium]